MAHFNFVISQNAKWGHAGFYIDCHRMTVPENILLQKKHWFVSNSVAKCGAVSARNSGRGRRKGSGESRLDPRGGGCCCCRLASASCQRPCTGGSRQRCRISPPRFLTECCKRQLNPGSFVLLYFRLFTFSDLFICIFLYCFVCQYQSSDWL